MSTTSMGARSGASVGTLAMCLSLLGHSGPKPWCTTRPRGCMPADVQPSSRGDSQFAMASGHVPLLTLDLAARTRTQPCGGTRCASSRPALLVDGLEPQEDEERAAKPASQEHVEERPTRREDRRSSGD